MINKDTAVIIPAYNESETIQNVINGVMKYAIPIVVNDGSSDKTYEKSKQTNAIVISHSKNQGYDAALSSGIYEAVKRGYKYAITIDADAQHSPEKLIVFIDELKKGYDIVVGEREKHQRYAETIFSIAGKILWNINDPLCGMKGYKLYNIQNNKIFSTYASIGTEFAIKCAKNKMKIKNIPIITSDRVGISRFGNGIRPNIKIIKALIYGIFKA